MSDLPDFCFGHLDGQSVLIQQGQDEPDPISLARDHIDRKNHAMGVSREQRKAMEVGVSLGWRMDAAQGEKKVLRTYELTCPLTFNVKVEAYDDDHAIKLAEDHMNDQVFPDGTLTDGGFDIVWEHDPPAV